MVNDDTLDWKLASRTDFVDIETMNHAYGSSLKKTKHVFFERRLTFPDLVYILPRIRDKAVSSNAWTVFVLTEHIGH